MVTAKNNDAEVFVRTSDSEGFTAIASWRPEGMVLMPKSGAGVISDEGATYRPRERVWIDDIGKEQVEPVVKETEVYVRVVFSTSLPFNTRSYSGPLRNMYPRSTLQWYDRTLTGSGAYWFHLQRIRGEDSYWLTIVDRDGAVVQTHRVKPHEAAKLWMREDAAVWQEIAEFLVTDESQTDVRDQLSSILNRRPPVDTAAFWKLATGFASESLSTEVDTVRQMVEPLVPASYPPNVREEFLTFFAMIVSGEMPSEDPVDAMCKLASRQILWGLYASRLRCELDRRPTPPYPKILSDIERAAGGPQESSPIPYAPTWITAWDRIDSTAPDWTAKALKYIPRKSGQAGMLHLPVSREMAAMDAGLRKERAALIFSGYNLRTLVDLKRISMEQIVYTGKAHTWPHQHSLRSFELKSDEADLSSLQVVGVPRGIETRVRDNLEGSWTVEWDMSVTNRSAFHARLGMWTAPFTAIQKPVIEMSLQEMAEKLKWSPRTDTQRISRDDARAIDLTSVNCYLAYFESQRLLKQFDMDVSKLESNLAQLQRRRIIRPIFGIRTSSMPTVLMELGGEEAGVCGIGWSLIHGTPRTRLMVGERGRRAFALCKVPASQYSSFKETARMAARKSDVALKLSEVTHQASYTSDFCQRLLGPDGNWDADISELLSQISFPR